MDRFAASKKFAETGSEPVSCAVTIEECTKCGAKLKKTSSCGCDTDMVCASCGFCNYCKGTKRCQAEGCEACGSAQEPGLTATKCKTCMDSGECQHCLYR